MNDAEIAIRTRLLLSVQRALLGAVPAALRQVTATWRDMHITLTFSFDGPIDPDHRAAAEIVGTEVISDFPAGWTIEERIQRLDHPAPLPADGAIAAYRRRE